MDKEVTKKPFSLASPSRQCDQSSSFSSLLFILDWRWPCTKLTRILEIECVLGPRHDGATEQLVVSSKRRRQGRLRQGLESRRQAGRPCKQAEQQAGLRGLLADHLGQGERQGRTHLAQFLQYVPKSNPPGTRVH